MVFAHPSGDKGDQGKPEQQVQVGPENSAVDMATGMQHVVVIVPVNAQIDKTQHIGQKNGKDRY